MNAASDTNIDQQSSPLPPVKIPEAVSMPDFATILGLFLSFALIAVAIVVGQSNANFFNLPSVLIVVLGTMTATSVSYSGQELKQSLPVLGSSMMRPVRDFSGLAKGMLDIATVGRKRGVLSLSSYENQTKNEPFLNYALKLVVDGYNPDDIKRILQQDIDMEEERQKRAASILRRGSEVAPAMGLIGTLVGLVQMLADLDNPDAIGPAMAVALLTTFYGAIMGTVVMAPLAAKLEKNAADEVTMKTMTLKTCMSIVSQENPRNLEMLINSLLAPSQRIRYFD
ncbi:MAG: motility protein A [Alphaproteobacteria bacterium]